MSLGRCRRPEQLQIDADKDWDCLPGNRFHNHNMVWSTDDKWIYFVRGVLRLGNIQADEMDICRIPSSGGTPEQLTTLKTAITFLAVVDPDTLLYIAPAENGSGSWLWHLDVPSRTSKRALPGTEQVTYVSGIPNGRLYTPRRTPPPACGPYRFAATATTRPSKTTPVHSTSGPTGLWRRAMHATPCRHR